MLHTYQNTSTGKFTDIAFQHVVTIATNHTSRPTSQRCSQVTTWMSLTSEELTMKAPTDARCPGVRTRKSDSVGLPCKRKENSAKRPSFNRARYARPRRIALHLFWSFLCNWVACMTPTNMKTNPPHVHKIWMAHPLAFVGKMGSFRPVQ